jgi:CobQ-like glutamine amidotransferase family enzyme
MTFTLLRALPGLLSLNGSLGNAEVLASRLRWWGIEVSMSDLNPGEAPSERPDIVVWGHGTSSMVFPASDAIGPWRETFQSWAQEGTHWFGAGLGGDLLGAEVLISPAENAYPGVGLTPVRTTLRSERISQEVSGVDDQGREIAGYLNDAADREVEGVSPLISFLPVLSDRWQGDTVSGGEGVHTDRVWVSAVSGPFLALNPHVADDILRSALEEKGISLPEPTEQHRRVDLAAENARAWIRSRLGSR